VTRTDVKISFDEAQIAHLQGDSGGPLLISSCGSWEVHGITSFGLSWECARPNQPGVFARVYDQLDWIKEVTGLEGDFCPRQP